MCSDNQYEQEVWRRFQEGDRDAYSYLYHTYFKSLLYYGCRVVDDQTVVEDAIQDLFIRLWQTRANLDCPLSVKGYLFKSLRRIIYRTLEKQKRTCPLPAGESYDHEIQFSYEAVLIKNQLLEDQQAYLEAALLSLSKRQREVIHLKFYSKFK